MKQKKSFKEWDQSLVNIKSYVRILKKVSNALMGGWVGFNTTNAISEIQY
jgi:hypothetical protein